MRYLLSLMTIDHLRIGLLGQVWHLEHLPGVWSLKPVLVFLNGDNVRARCALFNY